jgi:predicted SAM-dependent methyltransferase
MDEYSRRNFFEHPSISAVIARHLASHHTRPDSAIEDRVRRLDWKILCLGGNLLLTVLCLGWLIWKVLRTLMKRQKTIIPP